MQLKPIIAAIALVSGMTAASAMVSQDIGPATISYDETTSFGTLSSWFSAGNSYGFSWTVPLSAQVSHFGVDPGISIVNVPMPDFTVTANAGWSLSNASAFIGNLGYVEVGGATTNIIANADVSVNSGPTMSIGPISLNWVPTGGGPGFGFTQGYFADTIAMPGDFNSLAITGSGIDLSATGGTFSSISAQPQNKYEISFTAMPVPEPETYVMFVAGLAALGLLTKRRRAQV